MLLTSAAHKCERDMRYLCENCHCSVSCRSWLGADADPATAVATALCGTGSVSNNQGMLLPLIDGRGTAVILNLLQIDAANPPPCR